MFNRKTFILIAQKPFRKYRLNKLTTLYNYPANQTNVNISQTAPANTIPLTSAFSRISFAMVLLKLVLFLTISAGCNSDSLWCNLRSRYLGLKSLSGNFAETVCSETEETCQAFSGKFFIVLPDHYRLEVTSPQHQLIVCEDSVLWFYFEQEKKAVRQVEPHSVPLLAFLDPLLDTTATAVIVSDTTRNLMLKVVTPDSLMSLSDFVMELDTATTKITAFSFTDAWGNEYHFQLSHQKWNPDLSWKIFHFTPPPGTDIN